jgi:hypothetical protein
VQCVQQYDHALIAEGMVMVVEGPASHPQHICQATPTGFEMASELLITSVVRTPPNRLGSSLTIAGLVDVSCLSAPGTAFAFTS